MLVVPALAGAPADRLPTPSAERCVPFAPVQGDDGVSTPAGLGYPEIKSALDAVLPTALYCGQPAGMKAVHLTFDLTVGCDGLVSRVETVDDGGAPADYVACVVSVLKKADFPAHDLDDGQLVTYPVNVAW